MAKSTKGGLGRGLSSLMGGAGNVEDESATFESDRGAAAQGVDAEYALSKEVPLNTVHPNPHQPRTQFNEEELEELAASIEKDGLLQPILVRQTATGYEIIAGERRWQACQRAGLANVPVRIKEADDAQTLELAMVENLQRSDLNPMEEARGYKRMMEQSGKTQADVAAAVSKGRSTVANALRLLELPEEAQQLLYDGSIAAGHARAILSIPSAEGRQRLTDKLKAEHISVRQAESYARLLSGRIQAADKDKKPPLPKFYRSTARSLTESLQTKVKVRCAQGKNRIEIEFKDEEDLKRLLNAMKSGE